MIPIASWLVRTFSRRLYCVLTAMIVAGCGSSPKNIPRAYPPEVLARYRGIAVPQDHVRVAGVRILPDGMLVDLVADVEGVRGPRRLASIAGYWSVQTRPANLMELLDSKNRRVSLYRQKRGIIDTPFALIVFFVSGPFGQYPDPPREILAENDGRARVVQSCVFRTGWTPRPGAFNVRLLPGAAEHLAKFGWSADFEVREVEGVRVPRERRPPRPGVHMPS